MVDSLLKKKKECGMPEENKCLFAEDRNLWGFMPIIVVIRGPNSSQHSSPNMEQLCHRSWTLKNTNWTKLQTSSALHPCPQTDITGLQRLQPLWQRGPRLQGETHEEAEIEDAITLTSMDVFCRFTLRLWLQASIDTFTFLLLMQLELYPNLH